MGQSSHSAEEDGILAGPIVALARVCAARPRVTLALVALVTTASLAYAGLRLQCLTHRNDLISKSKAYYQRWAAYQKEFGDDDDLVVAVEGESRGAMNAALDAVAQRVAARPDRFDRLHYEIDLRPLRDRALLFLPTESLRDVQERVRPMALLLEPPVIGLIDPLAGWKRLTLPEMAEKAALVNGPFNLDATTRFASDPLLAQLAVVARRAREFAVDGQAYVSPWRDLAPDGPQKDLMAEPWRFFSPDGTLAFLLVRPTRDESDGFVFAQKSIDALRTILAEVGRVHASVRLGLTGMPVLENDEMVSTQSDSMRASWLALAGVALLYLVVYRSIRYPLMTVVALLVGTAWALGWLTLTVGHLNILSSAFAVMLIGMGDYGVLWVTRFRQERAAGLDPDAATAACAASVGPSVLTAALATAVAFFATMLADLKAVAELGFIAGSGVLLCALSCFIVMPALLALFDRHEVDRVAIPLEEAAENRRHWLPRLMRRPGLVLAVGVVVTAACGWFARNVPYDHNLLNLQSPHLDSVKWERKVLERNPEGNLYALSATNTPEEAVALKERYERLPGVSRVVEAASLVPRDQPAKLEILRDLQTRLRRLPERGTAIPHDAPDPATLTRTLGNLHAVLEPASRSNAFLASLVADLDAWRTALAGPDAAAVCMRLREFHVRMGRDLMNDLHRLREVSRPAPIAVADLPPSFRERYVSRSGKWLVAVFSKQCLWEYPALEQFTREVQSVDAEATGRPFTILEGLRAMRSGFLWAGVYAFIAMTFVLLLDFGTVKHATLALVPLGLGMIAALGCLACLGFSLNPANLIAFPLILGVGADNGVHVLHDFRSRVRGTPYHLSHCTGRGIMVAALTTILGFGTLIVSQHRGLASLGLALTLGVSACMFASLIFLPALLGLYAERQVGVSSTSRRAAA